MYNYRPKSQNFILKGVDLIDHTSIFLLRTINHYQSLRNSYNVYTFTKKNSEEVPVGTNHESVHIIRIT